MPRSSTAVEDARQRRSRFDGNLRRDAKRKMPRTPVASSLEALSVPPTNTGDAPRPKSKLYLSAVAEARRLLGKRLKPENVVEHLLHDNRFHVLFPSHDGRSIGEDCRDCAEEIVAEAVALRALKAAPLAT